jgi:hypothetical protein
VARLTTRPPVANGGAVNYATFIAVLLLASTARADCPPDDFECGLSVVELGQTPSAAPKLRSQLVEHDTKTPKVVGAISGFAGGVSLLGAWAIYVARQGYRLEPRASLGEAEISRWEGLGSWSFWLAAGGAAGLVVSEALLLPESADGSIPTLAWLGGAAGLAVAAVGVGFAVGGAHCAPIALTPGSSFRRPPS